MTNEAKIVKIKDKYNKESGKEAVLQDFLTYNEQKKLLMPGDTVVAGVSGGADSVCLLALLDELKEKLGLTLYVIHVHHGIRGAEADRDAAFVRELAGKKNLPFCLIKKDVSAAAKELGMTEGRGRKTPAV